LGSLGAAPSGFSSPPSHPPGLKKQSISFLVSLAPVLASSVAFFKVSEIPFVPFLTLSITSPHPFSLNLNSSLPLNSE